MTRPPILLSSHSLQSDRSLLHTCLAPWHYPSKVLTIIVDSSLCLVVLHNIMVVGKR